MNAHSLMLAALKLAEWGGQGMHECPVCGNKDVRGHEPDCKLAAAIREGEKAK